MPWAEAALCRAGCAALKMRFFEQIDQGIDVSILAAQIDAQPALWGANPLRLEKTGPFAGTSDIWVRYRDPSELTSPKAFLEPHFSSFYPAWHVLPALKPIVFRLMAAAEATVLGGILITRIPAGGEIKSHHDRGTWHAEFYARKVYVPIRANPLCVNRCEEESVVMKEGEAWWFDNQVTHSVENPGDTERMTLIVCMSTQ